MTAAQIILSTFIKMMKHDECLMSDDERLMKACVTSV